MYKQNRNLRFLLTISAIFSMLPLPPAVMAQAQAQEMVASEEVGGGSSVFVFREGRNRPQAKASGGTVGMAGGGRVKSTRSNAQIAAAAQKRRLAAIAARKQAEKAAANRKIAMSNTLTAKAETFLDSNQTDAAIKNFRDALVQNPKNTRATDGLSTALTAKGIEVAGDTNNAAAIVFFDEAIKIDKNNDVAYAKLGAIYEATSQKDKATASYEKAIAINPDYTTLYMPLSLAYLEKGEIAKAETYLQKSEAAGLDNADVRFLRGVILFKQNKNAEALAAFDRTLEMDARNPDALYYKGQTLDRLGKADLAIASYKKTIEVEPKYAPASFDLGVAYYNKGDYKNAAAAYQEVVSTDNTNYQAHANLASSYRQQERYAEANAEYKIAETGVKTAELYSEWGYSLGKVKEWEQAVAKLARAKELNPDAIDNSNLGWAYYNAATELAAQKNTEGAKTNYALAKVQLETAVKQDPKLDAAYLNLGSTHNAMGEFQAAVSVLTAVLGFRRDWVIATNQLGLGYRGLNDLKNAIATFKRATDLDGKSTFGLYNLGEVYFLSGNKNEAKKVNDRLKKLDPTLATRLDNVISGKIVIDAAKQKIEQKIPIRIPKFPF